MLSTISMNFGVLVLKVLVVFRLIDEPQPTPISYSPNLNTISKIWTNKRSVNNKNYRHYQTMVSVHNKSEASKYIILNMFNMRFPCKSTVKDDAQWPLVGTWFNFDHSPDT